MDEFDCAVIGAGVVGLAVARALAQKGREVIVLEAEGAIGTGTSSRNSEVIHAGIYYPEGSLKARLCVEGKQLLYDYATKRGLPHRRCGKLIVATAPAQVAQLEAIAAKARANGVDDLVLLSREEARAMEPNLECLAALHSPSTGIVDSHALMLSLQGDLEDAGGVVALKSAVVRAECADDAIVLLAQDGTALHCNSVVNAAGLAAPALARRFEGLPASAVPSAHFAKGSYFTLAGRAPFSHLIYPVPEAAGLGVHLTLDLGGQAKFGPDVQWVDSPDDLVVDPKRGDGFYAEVRKYWPALSDGALIPGYAGIRPKISGPGEPARDFLVEGPATHGVPGLVNLFGIESPGLTSSLAIGRHVAALLP
ncbi:NAD(P)/FAD-dependent oxidoreductase [Variovorax sp. MHTC-1]|uniref:NAD(P)/FAD-dependent oxidoreductase n=1 Tax=Variovorax sp. MHTC-1 TaxID=2495593 RepID=UPI000F8894E9|nr:NAD(P)/FAD-dependent oxidoreductase [Variovorax sp. MHTC-1]RST53210.1 NAD(P)/FAD-dependent oxidoreductase [Variovorax sp. MHTC-1]